MEPVVAPLIPDIRDQQNKESQADAKSGDVDEAENADLKTRLERVEKMFGYMSAWSDTEEETKERKKKLMDIVEKGWSKEE